MNAPSTRASHRPSPLGRLSTALAALVVAAACSSSSTAPMEPGTDANDGVLDAGQDSGAPQADASPKVCDGHLPIGATQCASSAACCQTGGEDAGAPVGAGCVFFSGTAGTCVPRCNSDGDCKKGDCCIPNMSSVPTGNSPPTEPGGFCVSNATASAESETCLSSPGNGYICTGNGVAGYSCAPAVDGGSSPSSSGSASASGASSATSGRSSSASKHSASSSSGESGSTAGGR